MAKFFYQWGGSVMMGVAFLIGIPDSMTNFKELVAWVNPFGMQPIHVAFWLLGIGAVYTTIVQGFRIKKLEEIRPKITVEPVVKGYTAQLEIKNIGGEADFTASARVQCSNYTDQLFTVYWEPVGGSSHHIDGDGGLATIIVGEKATQNAVAFDKHYPIFKGSLVLFSFGNQGQEKYHVFSGEHWEKKTENSVITGGDALERCIVEITITTSPSLLKKWGTHRYLLDVDKKDGHLEFSETKLLTPRIEVPPPESVLGVYP